VRWGQWKGTEVGEKFMGELKAAFEKDHPDIKLVPVDSPFTGFHDRAIVLHQAKKLPDVLLVQVDWVAEFADLGMIDALDDRIAKEPKEFFDNIPDLPPEVARQAVLSADRERCGRAVLEHRSVQGGWHLGPSQDLGRVRGDVPQADQSRPSASSPSPARCRASRRPT
jgi:hypothetical protein